MFSKADFCGEGKQKHFSGFPSDCVNVYLLGWALCVLMNIH